MDKLKTWLATHEMKVDNLGRVVIDDETVIAEINGAYGSLPGVDDDNVDMFDSGCGGCSCGQGCGNCRCH